MEWAEYEFRHSATLEDGTEAGDHMQSAQRQLAMVPGRRRPKPNGEIKPEGPPFPEPLDYLWELFTHISMGLPISGMAPPTISWNTLHAWQQLNDTKIEPWEAETLVKLGMMRAGIQSEQSRNARNRPTAKDPPARIPRGKRPG